MNDRDILVTLAAVLAVGAVLAIFLAGVIAPKPNRQKAMDIRFAEDWLAAHQEDRYRTMRAERTHMLDAPRYKPAVFYVSPERPEPVKPANVTKLRRKS